MSYSSRRQRGPYASKACTNCRKKHLKCSEGVNCVNCVSHNLQCIYDKSIRKRGPRTVNRSIYVFENNFDKTASIEQEHTSTEYQFNTFIPSYFIEEPQPIQSDFFLNQVDIDTDYIMVNNNSSVDYSNSFSLLDNSFPSSIEEPQPTQNDFFLNQVDIDTNYIMANNNSSVNYSNSFSLLNNSFPSFVEESQPTQNDFFLNQVDIDTNYIMANNNSSVNFSNSFSLFDNSFPSSIASNSFGPF
ncbi:25276_t:CDS:1 [Gigaspora margarita]|uniref:25276_t:CDS:1 n=1 Tax=Gigaspora margarita TaxID=4874 RepID=A0ABN7WNK3_GIGMA|nr:25276_t:CDS:1 [Gigaspora margarita]